MMLTVAQASQVVLGAPSSGLGSSVAVAIGALVVVLAIVLVFVMVLRSNGGARKAANGIGYDAQQGPIGQPQGDGAPAGSPWQQAPAWNQDFANAGAAPAQAPRGGNPAWNQGPEAGAGAPASQGQPQWGAPQAGAWNAPPSAQPSAPAWGAAPVSGGQAAEVPWAAQGGAFQAPQAPASRPASGMPAAQGGWGAPASQPAAAWDQGERNAPAWGGQAQAGQRDWGMPAGGMSAGGAAPAGGASSVPGWGMDAAPASTGRDWNSAPAGGRDWAAAPAPAAPQSTPGFDGNAYGGDDKTRVVRPGGQQRSGMIVVRQGKEPGRIFEVRKDRLTIGRSRESDIFLEDLAVSRLHTTVARDDQNRYILRDENSANGTYVNGQRVSEHVLEEGDEIQVGQTVLAFVRR